MREVVDSVWGATVVLFLGVACALTLFGVSQDEVILIVFVGLAVLTAPGAALAVLLAARTDRVAAPSAIIYPGLLKGLGVIWGGATFALGLLVASVVTIDLERLVTAAEFNSAHYLWQLLVLLSGPILWAAWVVVSVPAAWGVFRAGEARRARALLHLLPESERADWPLATRMWLNKSSDNGSMPGLPDGRLDWWVRQLSTTSFARSMLMATVGFAACALMGVAVLIGS